MEYLKALKTSELPLGTMKMVLVADKEILLSNVDGKIYAISNVCTHMGGSLVKGKLEGNVVTCPRHGAKFDVTNGKAVGPAKILMLKKMPVNEQIFEVKVEGDDILIGSSQFSV